MSYPFEDNGFMIWYGDLETQIKRMHGVSAKDLGLERRSLQKHYYSGESVFSVLDRITRDQTQG
ncbi:MAG: hypothetical protein HQL38_15945 [Alphaproteobacteria bacterium]|nr:hypothetical protein [Alphaproteobacteria bacterium]